MQSVPEDLKGIMGPNEQVQLYIRQKIYHPKINVDSVVITTERIILRHPHAFGLKKDYTSTTGTSPTSYSRRGSCALP